MVFPKSGLSPATSASSAYSRPPDEISTVKAAGGASARGSLSGSSRHEKRDRSRHRSRSLSRANSSYSARTSSNLSAVSPGAGSGTSTSRHHQHPHSDFDEGYIQKLITEGLWSDKPEIIEDVLNKISNLMFTSDEELKTKRRDAIYRAGGHLAIVQAMKRNQKCKGIQTQGCRALANATWETSDFMNAIAAVGGVDVILAAMREFPKDEVVQICGACAMRNLTSMRRIARMIVERDGLPIVLNAMKTFPMNANIQECGCWTIAHLCLDKENIKYIQKVKCFASIGAAADCHSKQPDVLVAARQATERLWEILLR